MIVRYLMSIVVMWKPLFLVSTCVLYKLFSPTMTSVIESIAKFIFPSSVISRSNGSSLSHVQANNQSWRGDRNIFCVKISEYLSTNTIPKRSRERIGALYKVCWGWYNFTMHSCLIDRNFSDGTQSRTTENQCHRHVNWLCFVHIYCTYFLVTKQSSTHSATIVWGMCQWVESLQKTEAARQRKQ